MSDLSPECAQKRTSGEHAQFRGSRPSEQQFECTTGTDKVGTAKKNALSRKATRSFADAVNLSIFNAVSDI